MKPANTILLATCLLPLVEAQETADLYSILVSDAFSVYSQVTSILVSAAFQATATTPSATEASTTFDSQSATASTSVSTASESSSYSYTPASSSFSQYTSSVSSSFISTTSESSTTSPTSSSSLVQTSSTLTTAAVSKTIPSDLATSSVLGSTAETSTPAVASSRSSHDHNLAIILGTVLGALALGLLILALLLCWKRRHDNTPRHRALFPDDDEVESWRLNRQSDPTGSINASQHRLSAPGAAPLMSEHPAFRNYDESENPFIPAPPPPRRTAPNSRVGLTDGTVPGEDPFLNEKEVAVGRPTSWKSFASNKSNEKDLVAAGLAGGVAGAVGAGRIDHHKGPVQKEYSADSQAPRQIHRKPIPVNHTNNSEPWPYSPVSPVDPAAEAAMPAKSPMRSSEESRRSLSRDAARANAAFDQKYAPSGAGEPHGHARGAAELPAGAAGVIAAAAAALPHHDGRPRAKSRSSERDQAQSRSPRRPSAMHRGSSDLSTSSSSSNYSHGYSEALPTRPVTHKEVEPSAAPTQLSSAQQSGPQGAPAIPPKHSRRNSPVGTSAAYMYPNRPANPSPLSSEVRREPTTRVLPHGGIMALPSRRSRGHSAASRYSFDSTPYDAYPSGGHGEYFPDESTLVGERGIVGDDRYPHMGVPRRKSGGEYDLPPQPQSDSSAPPLPRDNKVEMWMPTAAGDDTSTWRMSSGMPTGWQRQSPRNSASYTAQDSGARGGGARAAGRRLRASDFAGRDEYAREGFGQAL